MQTDSRDALLPQTMEPETLEPGKAVALPPGPSVPYLPTTKRAWVVIVLLAAQIAASLLFCAAISAWYVQLGIAIREGEAAAVTTGPMNPWESPYALFFWISLVGAWIFFFFWIYGVQRNLRALGNAHVEYTPAWAIIWYFVPLMCLYKPFEALREIWHDSDPDNSDVDGSAWRTLPVPFLKWWWGFHLTAYFVPYLVQLLERDADTLAKLQRLAVVLIATHLAIQIPHAILKLTLVWRVTHRQRLRHQKLLAAK